MMKRLFIFCYCFLLVSFVRAQQPAALSITALSDSFFIYTTYKEFKGALFPSNSMYWVTDKGVLLFDTPWDSTQFQPLLDSIEQRHHQKVILCIATHFHDDRSAGLDFFKQKGITTYSSLLTRQLSEKEHNPCAEYVFTQDTLFSLGTARFETYYPGPGHSADNIVLWFPQQQILYGGCLIKSAEAKGLGNLADADPKAWAASIRKLLKKYPQAQYIIPGHFDWKGKKHLQHTLQLLKDYNKQ